MPFDFYLIIESTQELQQPVCTPLCLVTRAVCSGPRAIVASNLNKPLVSQRRVVQVTECETITKSDKLTFHLGIERSQLCVHYFDICARYRYAYRYRTLVARKSPGYPVARRELKLSKRTAMSESG